jgi:hypothetical protein
MINKYNDFILEKLLNESVIFYAPPFKKVLNKLSSEPISKTLLDTERTDIKPDITFVNLDKEGYVSFTTMKNSKKILADRFSDVFDEEGLENTLNNDPLIGDDIWNLHSGANTIRNESPLKNRGSLNDADPYEKARNPIKLGRFINNIFPGKFTAREVEEFVNKFKSTLDQSGERFIEVSGEEIAYWYDYNNYKIMNGSLGSSCMARAEKRTFEIYTANPEVCRMLVLLEDDKLIGRSLIWKIIDDTDTVSKEDHLNFEYFLDRQYTIKDSDVEKFRTYAVEKGWAYKTYNNHHSLDSVTFKDKSYSVEMEVQLTHSKGHSNELTYDRFPYVDTFRRYDPKTGILHNDNEDDDTKNIGCYILDSTSGGYTEVNDTVYSDWHDCDIERDDAIYSVRLGDWIYREDSVTVRRGSRAGVYPDNYDDLTWSEWDDQYYHSDNSVWCDDYQDYIFEEDAVTTVTHVDDDGTVSSGWGDEYYHKDDKDTIILMDKVKDKEWYKKLKTEDRDWRDKEAIKLELLTLDYKNEYVLNIYKIETYLLKTDSEKDYFYLTEEDAKLLGYEIDKVSDDDDNLDKYRRITDWFDYYKDIETYKDKPTLFRDKALITVEELKSKIDEIIESEKLDDDKLDPHYWTQRSEFIEKWFE